MTLMSAKAPGKRLFWGGRWKTESQIEARRAHMRQEDRKIVRRASAAKWRAKNPDLARQRSRNSQLKLRHTRKSELIAYKGGKCTDCGESFPDCCFDFDHRDPAQKSFNLGTRILRLSIADLKQEADKCDLVCSNCHRIRTAGNPKVADKIRAGQPKKA